MKEKLQYINTNFHPSLNEKLKTNRRLFGESTVFSPPLYFFFTESTRSTQYMALRRKLLEKKASKALENVHSWEDSSFNTLHIASPLASGKFQSRRATQRQKGTKLRTLENFENKWRFFIYTQKGKLLLWFFETLSNREYSARELKNLIVISGQASLLIVYCITLFCCT